MPFNRRTGPSSQSDELSNQSLPTALALGTVVDLVLSEV